jgi:glycosyltransferase involved in cell wall biosynthesis
VRKEHQLRLLFCLPTTALSGGVKIIFEFANRLTERGVVVEIFSFAGPPRWFALNAPLIDAKLIEDIPVADYDYVLVSNAFMIPLVLPLVGSATCVFFCQDYESFHHGTEPSYDEFMAECPTFIDIYKLPVPIITISRPVKKLIRERTGRDAYYQPLAIDKTVFYPRPRKPAAAVNRIAMVGNYLMPYKGIRDGLEALRKLAEEVSVQLVLITQERRGRSLFDEMPFPIELHYCPTQDKMPEIYTTCDVYCCTSWYEGLGLPAIECFACGVPVVSTSTYGVLDYGVDGENLLLARPNDPQDLYEKLRMLIMDEPLAERLRAAALETAAQHFDWDTSVTRFQEIIDDIEHTYCGPGPNNASEAQELLTRLEREGNLTPIAVFNQFETLCGDLHELMQQLRMQTRPGKLELRELERLRDGFRDYIGNEAAEYYDAFKAKYDLCQLLMGFSDHPRLAEYVNVIMARRTDRESRTAPTLSEIQYI